jgi:hypothetical protein
VDELGLRPIRNGRLAIYRLLEEKLSRTTDGSGILNLPQYVSHLYYAQGMSQRQIACEMTARFKQPIYNPLVAKMFQDFRIPKKAFRECVAGRKHVPTMVLDKEQERGLAAAIPAYDLSQREAALARGVRMLDGIPVEGNAFNHVKRLKFYAGLERELIEHENVCLPIFLHDRYYGANQSAEAIADELTTITGRKLGLHRVIRMIKDVGLDVKARSVALAGKTRPKKSGKELEKLRKSLLLSLPEYDAISRREAIMYRIKLLEDILRSDCDELFLVRAKRYVSAERTLGKPLPLYLHYEYSVDRNSLKDIARKLTTETGQHFGPKTIDAMVDDFSILRWRKPNPTKHSHY